MAATAKITLVEPFTGHNGNEIRSKFSSDGRFAKRLPSAWSAGELVEILSQLPPSLPICSMEGDGINLSWVNVGDDTEGLLIQPTDPEDWE